MIEGDALVLPPEAAGEAGTFLRAGGAGEEALIAALTRSAAELCEQFTATVLIARGFSETLKASGAWQKLARTPVRGIGAVQALAADGSDQTTPPASYAIDIDANGDGWIRVTNPAAVRRVRVTYQAGLAAAWENVPAALRQGVIRLAAHLYAVRGAAESEARRAEPPAAVTALWRPYRRLRLA